MIKVLTKSKQLPHKEIKQLGIYPTQFDAVWAIADVVCQLVKNNPRAVITYATGNTQVPVYEELARRVATGIADFSQTTAFHLDEYYPLSPDDPLSFVNYLERLVFKPLKIGRVFTLNGDASNPQDEANRYNSLLKQYPQDLVILGIGPGGHIAFNEPGSSFDSVTRLIDLSADTIKRDHKDRCQNSPTQALTQGISNILSGKKVILNAFGEEKGKYLREMLFGPITTSCPASALRLVGNKVTVFCDEGTGLANY